MRLTAVIDELVEERGLDKDVLGAIICEGMHTAYQKKYPELTLRVRHDKKNDDVAVEVEKNVVSTVQDPEAEISVRKARHIDEKYSAGDTIWLRHRKYGGRCFSRGMPAGGCALCGGVEESNARGAHALEKLRDR